MTTCKRCSEGKAMYCAGCLDELMGDDQLTRAMDAVIEAARAALTKLPDYPFEAEGILFEALQAYDEATKP